MRERNSKLCFAWLASAIDQNQIQSSRWFLVCHWLSLLCWWWAWALLFTRFLWKQQKKVRRSSRWVEVERSDILFASVTLGNRQAALVFVKQPSAISKPSTSSTLEKPHPTLDQLLNEYLDHLSNEKKFEQVLHAQVKETPVQIHTNADGMHERGLPKF